MQSTLIISRAVNYMKSLVYIHSLDPKFSDTPLPADMIEQSTYCNLSVLAHWLQALWT